MSVDKVNNTEAVSNMIISNAHARRQSRSEETESKDIVSIGNSEETGKNATRISWPPFFPIGDAQGIFKIEK